MDQSRCSVSESRWQDILCNSRANDMCNLLRFGKEIKIFLQIL